MTHLLRWLSGFFLPLASGSGLGRSGPRAVGCGGERWFLRVRARTAGPDSALQRPSGAFASSWAPHASRRSERRLLRAMGGLTLAPAPGFHLLRLGRTRACVAISCDRHVVARARPAFRPPDLSRRPLFAGLADFSTFRFLTTACCFAGLADFSTFRSLTTACCSRASSALRRSPGGCGMSAALSRGGRRRSRAGATTASVDGFATPDSGSATGLTFARSIGTRSIRRPTACSTRCGDGPTLCTIPRETE